MKNKQPQKAALYCRLSVDDGRMGESVSIGSQKLLLEQYCKDHAIDNYEYSFGDEESIFVDFYELIDNDSEISRDDFLDGFLETMETKGKLLQLNPAFFIETNMIKTKYATGLTSSNPRHSPDVVNNIPEGTAFSLESQLLDKTEMFFKLVDHYQFISEDRAKCNFDSEEFIELLKEIKELDIGVSDGTYTGGVSRDASSAISTFRNDEVLTLNEGIRCFYDYKMCQQRKPNSL